MAYTLIKELYTHQPASDVAGVRVSGWVLNGDDWIYIYNYHIAGHFPMESHPAFRGFPPHDVTTARF